MKSPQAPKRTFLNYRRQHSLDDMSTPSNINNWLVVPPLPGFQPAFSEGPSATTATALDNNPSAAAAAIRRSPSQRVRKAILDRLHQLLPQLLEHLANPTHSSASKACSLLMKQKQLLLNRQISDLKKKQRQQQQQRQKSKNKIDLSRFSPPKSPRILQWLSSAQQTQQGNSNNRTAATTTIADRERSESMMRKQQEDDEWERLVVTPFLLLLTAEVWVADLQLQQQQQDDQSSLSLLFLQGLYQRARQDIWNTQHVLRQQPNKQNNQDDTMITTTVVYQTLEGLLHWISVRCQVLQILSCPFVQQQQAEAFHVLWDKSHILSSSSSTVAEDFRYAQPLIQALQKEVQVYREACDACSAIQQAR